jgi:hypothetical protein
MRVLGLEPRTYGLKVRKTENVTDLKATSYNTLENHLTANLTENDKIIQQNLAKIINRWSCLPENVRHAIMILIGEDLIGED